MAGRAAAAESSAEGASGGGAAATAAANLLVWGVQSSVAKVRPDTAVAASAAAVATMITRATFSLSRSFSVHRLAVGQTR